LEFSTVWEEGVSFEWVGERGRGLMGFVDARNWALEAASAFAQKSLLGRRPDLSLFLSAEGVAKVSGVVLLRGGCVVVLVLKNREFGPQERAIVEEEVPSCSRRS
jgi:hypothetical protein